MHQAAPSAGREASSGERLEGGIGMSEFWAMAALITFVVTVVPLLLSGVIHVVVTTGAAARRPASGTALTAGDRHDGGLYRSYLSSPRLADDGDRACGAVDDRVTDRAEEHPLVGASTTGSHDH
jgi:hypothetical protein